MTKSAFISPVTLLLLPLTAVTVTANGVLTIKPEDGGAITFGEWEYRESSTRSRFWVGCWMYDFLQGSGWFPSTWYQYIDPTETDGSDDNLEYAVDRTLRAKYCNAQPDQYNYLDVKHIEEDGTVLDGFLRIFPDDTTSTSITVRCGPAGVISSPCATCTLNCETATIAWDGRGTAEITVTWEELS